MLSQVGCKDVNKIGGQEAVNFFKRSGLGTEQLKQFWIMCAKTNMSFLTKNEFYTVLRLIAYAQNGIAPTEASLESNIEVALPNMPNP